MRHTLMLTALTLLVTSLSTTGCAQTRPGLLAEAGGPVRASKKSQEETTAGHLADPSFLFDASKSARKTLRVKALAYTGCSAKKSKRAPRSIRGAWGDPLTPDVKAVAVSPDLLEMGLDHGDTIRIEGLPGEYKVLDVMHGRHAKAIDIYYGDDQCGAMEWGSRSLTITWQ
jgi:3D (Asp-Asp-Asp) domain-containing protein